MRPTTTSLMSLVVLASFGLGAGALSVPVHASDAETAQRPARAEGPSEVVRSVAERFLTDLNAHRALYRKDPKLLREAVDKDVLPYFDVQFAARLVLARYWRTATPAQRKAFVSAFENSVFANYGNALLNFQANHFRVLPSHTPANATQAIVRTVVRRDNGSTVQVNFALHKTDDGWKAWDVIIEGISYVMSFREDFGSEIQQLGLEAVIQRLEKGAKPPQISRAAAGR